MKKCNKCEQTKSLTEFRKQKKHKDGHKSTCKECLNKTDKKYRADHSKQIKDYQKTYRNIPTANNYATRNTFFKSNYGLSARTIYRYGFQAAIAVYERDGRKCKKCGNENDLTIHHKDRNGYYNPERGKPMNNRLSNLIVLCRKCHGRIHGIESHKK